MKSHDIRTVLIRIGVCLVLAAMISLFFWQRGIRTAQSRAEYYALTLRDAIPAPQGAVPETRLDNTMPTLSVDGIDFVGILEMPRYGSMLPVCGDWGRPSKYPRLFHGSVYDRTLQIGGSSQTGQLDFFKEISVGDEVCFTDMAGNRYSYAVTDLRYVKNADRDALQSRSASLTLFIKNEYAFEYLLVFCDTPN
ncbi:MAG: hypothetical protein IJO88_05580 [Oscillospiraceae bacterium]|nr:hypothetical protein [Oscillospiraceae bacterium]